MIPMYNTVKFTDIYETDKEFLEDYKSVKIPQTLPEDVATTLYYLLYSRFANSPIVNNDVNQFKYRLFATIYQYGPTWDKRLSIQDRLRNLSEDEIRTGFRQISNRALNPDSDPSTQDLDELTYVNSQDVTKSKKSILASYQELWDMLKIDVTDEFLNKFKPLFKQVVIPEHTYIYETEEE